MSLRSPLGRVLGLGSAKDGTAHWWSERLSSAALIPLSLWFVLSLLSLPALDYAGVRAWLSGHFSGFLAILLVAVSTHHSYLGTAEVIADYVHADGAKLGSLLLLRFVHVLVGGVAIYAVLRVAFAA